MLELVILQEQQQRLEHRHGQQAVGQDRQQDVRQDARPFVDGLDGATRYQGGSQHRQRAEGQQQEQQVLHRYARAGEDGQQDHRRGDQAGGIEEVQHQAGRGQQLLG
ncbi:hypothetical protein D3C81_1955090 [compost metagenome]